MKIAHFVSIGIAGLLGQATSASAQNRTFDFLGFRSDVIAPPLTRVAGKKCKVAQTGVSRCSIYAGAVLGDARPTNLTVTFNNAHMVMVTGSAIMNTYFAVAEAFVAKYGKPTSTEIRPWQNSLGMTIDNPVQVWEFADGRLELRQHGSVRNVGEFSFIANHDLPPNGSDHPPKVNF